MNNKIIYSFLCIALAALSASAQQRPNWQNLDLQRDSVFGISTEKAYTDILIGKSPHPVIVTVIDAGVDTLHEDLAGVLWHNPKKKKGDNGTYGWSYIGSAKGNVHYDNLELTRQVRQFKGDTADATYQAMKKSLEKQLSVAVMMKQNLGNLSKSLDGITKKIGKEHPTLADFKAYQPQGPQEQRLCYFIMANLRQHDNFAAFKKGLDVSAEHYGALVNYQLNTAYDPRPIVGDDYFNSKQHDYGSPDVMDTDPTHGTHVSGIIGAIRNNGIGINGICDDVQIMEVRAVPNGDERDKDIANAIRYAADHGAKVINMSFGKPYSQDKKAVDKAVKYALRKDVLLVQAAGNSDEDIDTAANFPTRIYLNGKQAGAWIVVGASGMTDDGTLAASFSNYGKTAVDVFAPGEQIYSTTPGSKYAYMDGTSMACPVVAGLAALIREYYPMLKAEQVKEIIIKSVVQRPSLRDKCVSGGVVNAYNALKLASTY
jgi:cell wall-associated protease